MGGDLHSNLRPPPPLMSSAACARRAADRLSVAPMMEWTTPHFRFLARLLTRRTLLYTEMYVDNTLLFSPLAASMLRIHPVEHPVACQLGGACPDSLARAAVLAAAAGYDEINLNCGCPSAKVAGEGAFGARLMFSPELVRDCVAAMRAVVTIPVTVKCRLGADDMDSFDAFAHFVRTVSQAGCEHFIVHARKCLLRGLSPKDNRSIPPLRYDWVQRLAMEMPHLRISINGGVPDVGAACRLLALRRGGAAGSRSFNAGTGSCREWRPVAEPALEEGGFKAEGGSNAEASFASAGEVTDTDDCCDGLGTKDGGLPSEADPRACTMAVLDGSSPAEGVGLVDASWPAWTVHPQCHLPGDSPPPDAFGADDAVLASVMIGRAAYTNPWLLATADSRVFGDPDPGRTRRQVVATYLDYCDEVLQASLGAGDLVNRHTDESGAVPTVPPMRSALKPFEMAKPLMGLFHGCVGGGRFRNVLTEGIQGGNKGTGQRLGIREAVEAALVVVPDHILDEAPGARSHGGL